MKKNTEGKLSASEQKKLLGFERRSAFAFMTEDETAAADAYADEYIRFLDASKTEREAVRTAIAMAEQRGFRAYRFGDEILPGGKYYYNNRGKALYLFVPGKNDIGSDGVRITAAHIDSPRIDLKPHPVYEDTGICYFKTHYYGGLKKYQWTTIPLALHGSVTRADGTNVDISIGEDPKDPVLCISDLLPHLAKDQVVKPLGEAIPAESLNLVAGCTPYDTEDDDGTVKLNILSLLNENYGITEADFMSAELCVVPAWRARYVGLDCGFIGAYGHDDRVCAYPILTGLFAACEGGQPDRTIIAVLADKEETGSDGSTGMQSVVLHDLIDELAKASGADAAAVRAASKCLSADVEAGYDPNFAEVYEKNNSALLNYGVALAKSGGARGKYNTSDASSEYVAFMRALLDGNHILWQTGELGKVDQGGGGTVAKFISKDNIDTVDIGVPVISMHAPFELIAKTDLYMTHRAMEVFDK